MKVFNFGSDYAHQLKQKKEAITKAEVTENYEENKVPSKRSKRTAKCNQPIPSNKNEGTFSEVSTKAETTQETRSESMPAQESPEV